MLWSARTVLSLSVSASVVRLSGVATNLGRGKYGESGNGACLGARERARGKRKGRERQGRAGEREGRDVAGGSEGGGMYCAMSLVMLRSVSNHRTSPRTGQRKLEQMMYISCSGIARGESACNGVGLERYLPDTPKHVPTVNGLQYYFRWDRTTKAWRTHTLHTHAYTGKQAHAPQSQADNYR